MNMKERMMNRMSRVEENKITIDFMAEKAKETPSGTFEQMMAWHLGTIVTILADISKSLAIIADGMNRKEGEQNDR